MNFSFLSIKFSDDPNISGPLNWFGTTFTWRKVYHLTKFRRRLLISYNYLSIYGKQFSVDFIYSFVFFPLMLEKFFPLFWFGTYLVQRRQLYSRWLHTTCKKIIIFMRSLISLFTCWYELKLELGSILVLALAIQAIIHCSSSFSGNQTVFEPCFQSVLN